MHKYAMVKDGEVINMIVWDGATELNIPYATLVLVDGHVVNIGDTYADGVFSPPVAITE
jgi:hypothetical protein